MTKEETIAKIAEKIKGEHTASFITIREDGAIHGRPMATQDIESTGSVWFMTSKSSTKIAEIRKNSAVCLTYAGSGVRSVSLSGTAQLSEDKAKIHELWNDLYKAWFSSENDPNIILIKVDVNSGEYWDYKGGKLGAYVDMAKAAITNDKADGGENETFKL